MKTATYTFNIYDQDSTNYVDEVIINLPIMKNDDVFDFIKLNKKEIEKIISDYYNLNNIFYSLV